MRTTMNGQFSADGYETESQSRITSSGMTMETSGQNPFAPGAGTAPRRAERFQIGAAAATVAGQEKGETRGCVVWL